MHPLEFFRYDKSVFNYIFNILSIPIVDEPNKSDHRLKKKTEKIDVFTVVM